MKKLLFVLFVTLALSGFSCKCHIQSIKPGLHKTTVGVIVTDALNMPDLLVETSIVVSNLEQECCGGTVIKSTENETLILTASHCIFDDNHDPMKYGYVGFNGDDKYKVKVIDYSRTQDLALLRVTDKITPKLIAILAFEAPIVGEKIWCIGYGAGTEDIMSSGIVAQSDTFSKHTPRTHCMIVDISAYYGNSGGGIYNESNELVGVLIQNGPQHPASGLWSYAVHFDEIEKFLQPHL